ncbi:hypothetical protein, partial [Mycobacterium sp. Lab-001]|uniref:hypothetical protein n=1 Tax=Mycobacterium sp. Lab-001 TaxID=3410136 RepID=UPI003D172B13
ERDLDRQRVSAAERLARAEDRRIVHAAFNEGKIGGNKVEFWCDALQRDREGNRAVLAALAPGLPPDRKLPVDPEAEQAHRSVLRRLGVQEPARQVQAASDETPYQRGVREHDQRVRDQKRVTYDDLGLPIAPVPAPVVVSRGKPKQLWTDQEKADALQRQLGQRFWPGTKPPPKGDQVYIPSPNDPYQYDEATGEWRSKQNYQARG